MMQHSPVAKASAVLLLLWLACSPSWAARADRLLASSREFESHHDLGSTTWAQRFNAQYWLKAAEEELKQQGGWDVANSQECSEKYGNIYLQRWRQLSGDYCGSNNSSSTSSSFWGLGRKGGGHEASSDTLSSWVRCYAQPAVQLTGCVASNMLLNSTAFMGSAPGQMPEAQAGSVQLGCTAVRDTKAFIRGRLHEEGMKRWLIQAHAGGGQNATRPASQEAMQACKPGSPLHVPHPVLALLRLDTWNTYHGLEFTTTLFAALAAMQQGTAAAGAPAGAASTAGAAGAPSEQDWEVVIADNKDPGPYVDLWRRLGAPRRLRLLHSDPYPAGTCLSNAVLAPYVDHMQSTMIHATGVTSTTQCRSLVIHAAALWLRGMFPELQPGFRVAVHRRHHYGHHRHNGTQQQAEQQARQEQQQQQQGQQPPAPPAPELAAGQSHDLPVVLWVSRARHEREKDQRGDLTPWQRSRMLPNADEVVAALRKAVQEWNAKACAAAGGNSSAAAAGQQCEERMVFQFEVAELSYMPFNPDQLRILMATRVLVGVHGAGLANQIFMHPGMGAVVELWQGMSSNWHYANMAAQLGHGYFNLYNGGGRMEPGQMVEALNKAMVAANDRWKHQRQHQQKHAPGRDWWPWRRP